jgi:hypothetical protein
MTIYDPHAEGCAAGREENRRTDPLSAQVMKRAKVHVQTVAIECPYCGAEIADPIYGSFQWEWQQVRGQVVRCIVCRKDSDLPARVSR